MIFRIGIVIGFLTAFSSFSQDEITRNIYYGNDAFTEGDYERAAAYYLDAVDQSPLNYKANYNLSNAYYRMGEHDKSIERMNTVVNLAPSSYDKSKAYHNIGNAHMMKQDLDGAIEAYENALRLNPSDEETRYNLAYALELKRQQDEQNKDQENSNGDGGQNMGDNNNDNSSDSQQENEENENNDENEEQDTKPEDGDKGDQESDGNSGTDPQDKKEQDGNGTGYTSKLSKEQIQNILDAYYKREKDLQKKLDKNKRIPNGSPNKKDW